MNTSTTDDEAKSNSIERRPTRPFTPYNVFFQLERERILQNHGEGYAANPPKIKDDNRLARPPSYRNLILAKNWYNAGSKKNGRLVDKTKRRAHGVVTFVELSKQISENWAAVDEQVKEYCTLMSQEDTKRYRIEMNAYIEKYGYESVKRTYKTRKNSVKFEANSEVSEKSMKMSHQVKHQIDSQAPFSQGSMYEITPSANKAKGIINRTSVPNNISQFLPGIGRFVEIDTSNYSQCNDIINADRRSTSSVSLLQFGADGHDENNDSNPCQVHLLRHQVRQDQKTFPPICIEISCSNNCHSREHSEHDHNPAYLSGFDIEPLPIERNFDDDTAICWDETPTAFNSHNFDWSFNHGEFGEDPLTNPIQHSTPSSSHIVNTGMNLCNSTSRRISSFDPPFQEPISDNSPLNQKFCFTAQDMEASTCLSEHRFQKKAG